MATRQQSLHSMSLHSALKASKSICSICHEPPRSKVVDRCGHEWCYDCIARWLKQDKRCPISKQPLSLSDLMDEFGKPIHSRRALGSRNGWSWAKPANMKPKSKQSLSQSKSENRPTSTAIMPSPQLPKGVRRVRRSSVSRPRSQSLDQSHASNTSFDSSNRLPLSSAAVREADLVQGMTFEYYTGTFDELPNFDALTPVDSGVVSGPCLRTLTEAGILRTNHSSDMNELLDFALRFDGYLKIDTKGTYWFSTESNDGSELYIDGKAVVLNGGQHYAQRQQSSVHLDKGLHSLQVTYFHKNGKLLESIRQGACLSVTMASSTLGWAIVDQLAQTPVPKEQLFTTGKMKQNAINRTVSMQAQHKVAGLNEEIKRLEQDNAQLKQCISSHKARARREQAELKVQRDELELQCKDLQAELEVERNLRRQAEARIGEVKMAQAERASTEVDMAAACFNALALAVKMQLGGAIKVNIASHQLYAEALARNVPYEEWTAFIMVVLEGGVQLDDPKDV
eukprot:TRINITY_DN6873_c0_g1_i1.p1 TRINITY_DN6873_c0_g1~~TRINITY_DN6873_c0_g1_i1.p1  ORF type:complete len:511 (+),score=131.09 TRINITY_DN6873_c0_g1_i1:21-1553(+)